MENGGRNVKPQRKEVTRIISGVRNGWVGYNLKGGKEKPDTTLLRNDLSGALFLNNPKKKKKKEFR